MYLDNEGARSVCTQRQRVDKDVERTEIDIYKKMTHMCVLYPLTWERRVKKRICAYMLCYFLGPLCAIT